MKRFKFQFYCVMHPPKKHHATKQLTVKGLNALDAEVRLNQQMRKKGYAIKWIIDSAEVPHNKSPRDVKLGLRLPAGFAVRASMTTPTRAP